MTDTTKPKRRKRPDDDARLARGLVLALECLSDLYSKIERDTGSDTEEQSARYQQDEIAKIIASVKAVNAGTALGPRETKP